MCSPSSSSCWASSPARRDIESPRAGLRQGRKLHRRRRHRRDRPRGPTLRSPRPAAAGQGLFGAWERLPFPTVAAVGGTCLGGGTELALASTFLLVSDRPELRIGLPEVRLGILPAWGGCTRLPRRVGMAAALDMILPGKAVNGRRAFKMGLADALLPEAQFLSLVRDFALAHRGKGRRPARAERPELKELLLERNPLGRRVLFDQARKKHARRDPRPLPGAAARHRGDPDRHRAGARRRLRRRGASGGRARHRSRVQEPAPPLRAHRGCEEGDARAGRRGARRARGRRCSARASWAAASPS